jgi:hypothetical protein
MISPRSSFERDRNVPIGSRAEGFGDSIVSNVFSAEIDGVSHSRP